MLRTTWRSLQAIIERVVADLAGKTDRLAGLSRIGIDELSYRKGQRYLMVVIDHDTGQLAWAAEGRCQDTVRAFFDALGPQRAAALAEVSADGAEWIHDVIRERAPQARICLDSYHVVAWANKALDKVRRRLAAQLRATGAADLKDTRWAVIKNPEDLTTGQRTTIAALHDKWVAFAIKLHAWITEWDEPVDAPYRSRWAYCGTRKSGAELCKFNT